MENTSWNDDDNFDFDDEQAKQRFPIADMISMETIVNLLINKGICTPEELFAEEQKKRQEMDRSKQVKLVQTPRSERISSNGVQNQRHNSSWLKRKMSKHRWARRLGTILFGWEWKKVKVVHGEKRALHL